MSSSSSHNQIQRHRTSAEEKIRWSQGKLTVTDEAIRRNKLLIDHMGRNIGHKQEVVKRRTEVFKFEHGEKHKSHDYNRHQAHKVIKYESSDNGKSHHQHQAHDIVKYESREKYKSHDHQHHHHQSREVVKYESSKKGKSHHQHQTRDVVKSESREKYKSHDHQHHHDQSREVVKYESRERHNSQHQHQSREKYHPSVSIPIPWW